MAAISTGGVAQVTGDLRVRGARFAIAVARFNDLITDRLRDGALETLRRCGAEPGNLLVAYTPGAFELPVLVRRLAHSGRYEGIIALGCVIRGATPHFDYVAGQCASGIASVALESGVPIGFGVLTVDSIEQALERAGTKAGNKGVDAALAAIEMVNVLAAVG